MNRQAIEHCFSEFLEKCWELDDIAPFSLVYIQLLLLFKDMLSQDELSVLLERQNQLRGAPYSDVYFQKFRKLSRNEMNKSIGENADMKPRKAVNRLLFCALLESGEGDFFYLTEPIFEFAREMAVSPAKLAQILQSEFAGFNVNN